MVNIMTTKSLKRIAEYINRDEGISLTPIIVIMVLMSVMGGVFTSIMGGWKVSAPLTINSNKAFYLAETAAMFALQEAKYKFFYGGSFNYGTRDVPYEVSSVTTGNITEVADYWFELPSQDNGVSIYDDDDSSSSDDDNVDDDLDDTSYPDHYTIVATGRVKIGGTTVAKRQIKIKADITDSSSVGPDPGIHTDGSIRGNGSSSFNVWKDDLDITSVDPSVEFSGLFPDSDSPPSDGDRDGVAYQAQAFPPPDLDEEFFKYIATLQGHYNPTVVNNYPNGNFYYDTPTNIPNITYISGDLSPCNNKDIYGIYWVKGDVSLGGNWQVNGIIICEGAVTMNGGGSVADPNMYGGIIQYGSANQLRSNGNPSIIQIEDSFFNSMNNSIPIINVISWQEAVSAN